MHQKVEILLNNCLKFEFEAMLEFVSHQNQIFNPFSLTFKFIASGVDLYFGSTYIEPKLLFPSTSI